jgi:aminoacrylate hydrolase
MLASSAANDQVEHIQVSGLSVAIHGSLRSDVVLLSAGLGGLGSYWKPQLNSLCKDHCVILYDHRGTGKSDRSLPDSYSTLEMGVDMSLILDALRITRAHIVGHAAGGVAGLELARSNPDRVRSLTIVNGWAIADPHFHRCFEIRLAIYEAGGPNAYLKAQPLFLFPASWISDHLSELDEQASLHAAEFQSESALRARINALRTFDFRLRLADIHCPVLLITAKDDMLVPSHCSQVLLSGLSSAFLVEIPWGGHAVNVTAANDFNQHLLKFLAQHRAGKID